MVVLAALPFTNEETEVEAYRFYQLGYFQQVSFSLPTLLPKSLRSSCLFFPPTPTPKHTQGAGTHIKETVKWGLGS